MSRAQCIQSPGEPTSCMASPAVIKDIRKAIKSGHVLSMADARLARDAGFLDIPGIDRTGMNDGVIYPADELDGLMRTGLRGARATPSARLTAPKPVGQLNCLVLMVDFSDNVGSQTPAHFQNLLFDPANPDSMHSFYKEMSYGKLSISGTVTEWMRADHPYSYYTHGESGTGKAFPNNVPGLLHEMLSKYCQQNSLAPFDVNGDAFVDGLFLIHAGTGAETEQDRAKRPNMIWSHKWVLRDKFVDNGVSAYAYFTAPEDGKLGVFAHEFGHFLGLPDLYDTSYLSRGVGDWCLMGGGSWNGGGLKPSRLSAWCLSWLGWIKPQVLKGSTNLALDTLAKDAKACCYLWTDGTSSPEYFLIENRQKTGRDSALPGSGLLLWHVDERQATNANALAYRVGLVQADGLRDLEFNANGGEKRDPFPGSLGVSKVSSATAQQPSTCANNGAPTAVALSNITMAGGIVSLTAKT